MRPRLSVVIATLLSGVAAVSAGSAPAATGEASFALKPVTYDPALAVTKSYFVLEARPGAVIADRIRVVNTGGRTGTAYLYPVDATTGQTSGAVYLSRQSPRHDVGGWIRLARNRVTLAPGANTIVRFTIHLPRVLRGGDHLGGIVAENSAVTKSSGHGALQIRIKHLTIDAVELQLPGRIVGTADVTGVKAGGEHGYQYVYLHLLNGGTIMIKPAGSLLIDDAGGRHVAQRSLQLDTFLPGTSIDYPVLLPHQALSPGRYTATVNLHSSRNRVLGYRKVEAAPFDVTRTFSFSVSSSEQTKVYSGTPALTPPASAQPHSGTKRDPATLALIAVVAVLGLGALIWLLFRRRARARTRSVAGDPQVAAAAAVPVAPVLATAAEQDEGRETWPQLLLPYEQPRRAVAHSPATDAAVAEPEPEPEPEPEAEPVPEPETVPEPEVVPAAGELDPAELRELIIRHDLTRHDDGAQPEPEPERPAERAPELDAGSSTRPRDDAEVAGLPTALLEAGLIALAALLAARLLKSD